jgi:hypothetical protein
MSFSKIDLSTLSEEELKKFRRELTVRVSSIENKLDRQAYGKMDDDEIEELENQEEECQKMIQKIDSLLNNRKR